MLNGNLIVKGIAAEDLIIRSFAKAEDMTSWEFEAYDAYDNLHGKLACEIQNINTLADLFGQDFSDAFYIHKNTLLAQMSLTELQRQKEQLRKDEDILISFLINPTPVDINDHPFPLYHNTEDQDDIS